MTVNIHGKDYKTVAERLNEAHEKEDLLEVSTEVLFIEPQVMVKATIKTLKGIFTGISAANPEKKIEAQAAVEVAETSAVGRALAFAGYAGSEIASADEIVKVVNTMQQGREFVKEMSNEHICPQCGKQMKLGKDGLRYYCIDCWKKSKGLV